MTTRHPTYSLIIPCYNEEGNLPDLIARCRKMILARNDLEILLVDNGSTDNSFELFQDLITNSNFQRLNVLRINQNEGYGFGIVVGLNSAKGEFVGWTHADLQTNPEDFLQAIKIHEELGRSQVYIKGKRYGRYFFDKIFTIGMTVFEYFLLGRWMIDINAQPNLMPRSFFSLQEKPPKDFSLDLFFFFSALDQNIPLHRFPVSFGKREHGVGHNEKLRSKLRYTVSTLRYSFQMKYQNKR